MIATTPVAEAGWNDQQRALFQAQMSTWQKDEVVGVLLALFLGTFGAHHFYLRRTTLGIVYLILSFTGIPTIVSLVECFFMPGRVRQYNLALATYFAGQLGAALPAGYAPPAGFAPAPGFASASGFAPVSGFTSQPVSTDAPPAEGIIRTCGVCGTGILPGAKFCGRCGTRI
jgi:TM2 domain-containing membrane protein YozV